MPVPVYNFRWRVLLIDGQVAELTAKEVSSTRMGIRFSDEAGTVLCLVPELVLMIERIDRNHQPFPVSDRDMVAMYERTRRPSAPLSAPDTLPFAVVRTPDKP
jgi:hypothetical protein